MAELAGPMLAMGIAIPVIIGLATAAALEERSGEVRGG